MRDDLYTIYNTPEGNPFVKYTSYKGSSTKRAGECKSYGKRVKNKKTHRR